MDHPSETLRGPGCQLLHILGNTFKLQGGVGHLPLVQLRKPASGGRSEDEL